MSRRRRNSLGNITTEEEEEKEEQERRGKERIFMRQSTYSQRNMLSENCVTERWQELTERQAQASYARLTV